MMALHMVTWILLGLFIQYQLLAADKLTDAATLASDGGDKEKRIISTDDTKTQDDKDLVAAESSNSFEVRDLSDKDGSDEDKRGYGKWRNLKWSQNGAKRNIGRWKNRKWRDMQSYGILNRDGDEHSLSKRFSENDFNSDEKTTTDIPGYGILNEDFIVPAPYGYIDYYGAGDDFEDIPDNYIDKRHMSRWNLIHRKLANLNTGSKRDGPYLSEVKRIGSRWRIIQNKLNQLHGGRSKRFAGRWKNQNWLLQQAYQKDLTPVIHDLQKRFVGKRKNNKSLLQRYNFV